MSPIPLISTSEVCASRLKIRYRPRSTLSVRAGSSSSRGDRDAADARERDAVDAAQREIRFNPRPLTRLGCRLTVGSLRITRIPPRTSVRICAIRLSSVRRISSSGAPCSIVKLATPLKSTPVAPVTLRVSSTMFPDPTTVLARVGVVSAAAAAASAVGKRKTEGNEYDQA